MKIVNIDDYSFSMNDIKRRETHMLIEHNDIAIDLWKIVAHHGYEHQKHKAIEEFSELNEALSRDLNHQGNRANIVEEMADAHIILAQLALIYGNNNEVCDAIRMKLARTLDRIEAEKMEAFGDKEGRT